MKVQQDKSEQSSPVADGKSIGMMPISVELSNKLEVLQKPATSEISPVIKDIEVVKTFRCAGIRPIGVSKLKVVKTMNVMGIRPIGVHTIDIVSTINQSGIRPIGSSSLIVSQTDGVMRNRPVAANTVKDSENMIGFLD